MLNTQIRTRMLFPLENEIDCMVYSLYMLTAEEIAIVEESV